jgi:tRNA (mo5U34)-methyltransferase
MRHLAVLRLTSEVVSEPLGDEKRNELQARIDQMGPWFYDIDLPGGLQIRSKVNETHPGIHTTRRTMVERALIEHFGVRLSKIRAIDLGCHEGYFSFALRNLGIPEILAVDVREENLSRARVLADLSNLSGVRFQTANCERLDEVVRERFDLTLVLGLLYHQENPIGCLRQAAKVCDDMLLIETQVVDDIDAPAEWGRRDCVHPYEGHFALVDESIYEDNLETGATPLALCPSPRALVKILEHLGFSRITTLSVPDAGNEQFVRGKRVIVAAWRDT